MPLRHVGAVGDEGPEHLVDPREVRKDEQPSLQRQPVVSEEHQENEGIERRFVAQGVKDLLVDERDKEHREDRRHQRAYEICVGVRALVARQVRNHVILGERQRARDDRREADEPVDKYLERRLRRALKLAQLVLRHVPARNDWFCVWFTHFLPAFSFAVKFFAACARCGAPRAFIYVTRNMCRRRGIMGRAACRAARANLPPPRKNSKRRGTHGRFPRGARKDSRAGTRAKHGYALMLLNLSVRVSRTVRRGCGGRRPGCSSPCHRLYGATSHKCLLLPRFGRFVRVSASFPHHYNKLPASRNQPEERALHAREQTMRGRARAEKIIFLKPAENTRLHKFHRSP